jgi:hypothetical protein
MTKPKKTPTRKAAKGRKQSSDDISSIAATWQAKCPKRGEVRIAYYNHVGFNDVVLGKAKELRSMLASLIGQDETAGKRKGAPK